MFSNYNWAEALENFLSSLGVMWQSMLGIFAVMVVLIVAILLLARFTGRSEKKKRAAEGKNE